MQGSCEPFLQQARLRLLRGIRHPRADRVISPQNVALFMSLPHLPEQSPHLLQMSPRLSHPRMRLLRRNLSSIHPSELLTLKSPAPRRPMLVDGTVRAAKRRAWLEKLNLLFLLLELQSQPDQLLCRIPRLQHHTIKKRPITTKPTCRTQIRSRIIGQSSRRFHTPSAYHASGTQWQPIASPHHHEDGIHCKLPTPYHWPNDLTNHRRKQR